MKGVNPRKLDLKSFARDDRFAVVISYDVLTRKSPNRRKLMCGAVGIPSTIEIRQGINFAANCK